MDYTLLHDIDMGKLWEAAVLGGPLRIGNVRGSCNTLKIWITRGLLVQIIHQRHDLCTELILTFLADHLIESLLLQCSQL